MGDLGVASTISSEGGEEVEELDVVGAFHLAS